ncbi:insulinase family protein [Mumia sp. zg.B53]|uniref:M16 family metallopeptidase n=1 Tax=unclassified Mumia TaxID=2621872 RepID=UPI001C6F248D|nr:MULTISPECIES: pitrilysin family protein [unclassified Mumia]MBW9205469.1 insulinase family protein [Mumia sp. zg.B17]MBW9216488.1 insulinase family protein [Mumia sp. zg.B53]
MTVLLDPDQSPGTTRTLLTEGGLVRRTVLKGGLRVVTEAMPGVRTATIGIWVGVGSRDEAPTLSGASHFLEHLLFKGTSTRSALDISAALDAVGGEMNAFTGKEYTCYHARVLDDDLPLAVDVLADMVTDSLITTEDVEAERDVILEEIAMNEDDPDDVVHNLATSLAWGPTPLGRPVAGDPGTIRELTRPQILRYYRRRYVPSAMVVSVAGNVDHERVVEQVAQAFGRVLAIAGDAGPAAVRRGGGRTRFRRARGLVARPTEQANVVAALPGVQRGDDRRHALGVVNAVLGGGMSSRLFQEIREKRGLAYSVYSFGASYADAGMLGVYAGCAPGKLGDVLKVVRDELGTFAERGPTAEELERGKGQLKGSVVLGLEDPASRMSRIAKADLLHGELAGIDDLLASIDAVTLDDAREVARMFAGKPALAVVGPFESLDDLD